MGLARVLGFCSAFLFASSVAAANIIDLGPSDYKNFGPNGAHTSGGIRSSVGQTVRLPPSLGTLSVTRNPVIPYGSVGGALRTIGRGTPQAIVASAAMSGLFLAMDWVFDQGEWKKEGYEYAPLDDGTFYWYYNSYPQRTFATPSETCTFYGQTLYPNWTVSNVYADINSSGTTAICRGNIIDATGNTTNNFPLANISRGGQGCIAPYVYVPAVGACALSTLIPLTDADYSDLTGELPALPAGEVSSAAGDAQRQLGSPLPGYSDTAITGPSSVSGPETTSTSTDPVTGDTVVTTSSTTTNITYGDTTITTSNTTVTNTYTNGQHSGSETTTETPGELPVTGGGGGGVADWPDFCDWATVVCDWLDWTREDPPPEQDLPAVIDEDFFERKTISFGSKSCPPDHEIDLAPFLETTVGVSFQPLCDFAGLIYYMVMAASYIIAAYISIGVARNA